MAAGEILRFSIQILTAIAALVFTIFKITAWVAEYKSTKKAKELQSKVDDSVFAGPFTEAELKDSLSEYVVPDCSSMNPASESDLRFVSDVRESVFAVVDRIVMMGAERKYLLVLADSGMGKTSFCLNYYSHFLKAHAAGKFVALVSLARDDVILRVSSIANKRDTTIILDALDEDAKAIRDSDARIREILKVTSDFQTVIITCRSQFFRDTASIPTDTGVTVITPRKGGDRKTYNLNHLFLLPFSKAQIETYLRIQFPLFSFSGIAQRRKARELVSSIPELALRPMLLELLPDLVRDKVAVRELYELYSYMVQKWCERERDWIDSDKLMSVSRQTAVAIYTQQIEGQGDRISPARLRGIAESISEVADDWGHLENRSLLNRDGAGNFKFAHRSILEFFFVDAALHDDASCLSLPWTDLMREIFVSVGHSNVDIVRSDNAMKVLNSDLRKTRLVPLSEPPAEPSVVTVDIMARAANRRSKSGRKRLINARWRAQSITVRDEGYYSYVYDNENDLTWKIGSASEDGVGYRVTIADVQTGKVLKSGYRTPSYEEFITLIDGLSSVCRSELLSENEYYLLGDQLGDRRYVVATIGNTLLASSLIKPVDKERPVAGTQRFISTYMAGIYSDPRVFTDLGVLDLSVRGGSLERTRGR